MKKRFFSSFLALLFILLITSCAGAYNDYKEKNTGSVSFNVGQIVESALRASRTVTREGISEGDDGPVTEDPSEEETKLEIWDCIDTSSLEIKVETKGEYITSKEESVAFDYKKYMDSGYEYLKTMLENETIVLQIPLGKTISIVLKIKEKLTFDDEKLYQLYEQEYEQATNEFSFEEYKTRELSIFSGEMSINLRGSSEKIKIQEGENNVTVTLAKFEDRQYYIIYEKDISNTSNEYELKEEGLSCDPSYDMEAFLEELCYKYSLEGCYFNEEKSDADWQEDDEGCLFKKIYFDYDENKIMKPLKKALGIDQSEEPYTIILYSTKPVEEARDGIYIIKSNILDREVSYGDWKETSNSDAKVQSYKFTEKLYLNLYTYGLKKDGKNIITDDDIRDGFRFESSNRKTIDFSEFESLSSEEIEITQYYNIYLWESESNNYKDPYRLPYNPYAAGAELKEYEYRYCNIEGWSFEKEDDWITSDNLKYKNVYYSYNETQTMSISHQTPAIVDGKETYELSMYALNSNPVKGIYFIDKTGTNNTGYSYGTWESTGVADVSLSSLKFTEELAYNTTNNCIGFAENVTAQTVDASNEFTLTSANGLTFSFASLETNTSVNGSGTITPSLPGKFEILEAVNSGINYFLNKGKIQFSLRDSTNEVPVDASKVDWDYELRCGRTIIPDDGTYYTHEIPGTLEFINLPASGTYRLYVEITPNHHDYENYEMASYVSEYNITAAYYEYNVSDPTADNYLNIDDYETDPAFEALAAAMSKSNVYLKLSGQVGTSYGNNLYHIKDICNPSYTLYLDIENFTAEEAANTMNYGVFDDWTRLTGITLPAVVTALECNDSSEHYSIFYNCPELQTVKFPNPQNWYVSSYRLVGDNLLNVDWDEELTQINVYNQETNAENLTSNWGYLYQRTE